MNGFFTLCFFVHLTGFAQPFLNKIQQETPKLSSDAGNYITYHRTIVQVQQLIAHQEYQKALNLYKQVFSTYDFVFVNDYKVATQLALYTGRNKEAFDYLKKGIANGWNLKAIKKNQFLHKLLSDPEWKNIESQYNLLHKAYQVSTNTKLRKVVKKMLRKDQWKALGALFTRSSKGQDRYAEKRFAPHSEKQLEKLNMIMNTYGYPGEKLIHNDFWTSVILSHHNSISEQYALKDTLYATIRPGLLKAIELGEMSPDEFALIDDWYVAVKSRHKEKQFGYLADSLTNSERLKADKLREEIGLSSIATINSLIDIQHQTGLNFYLRTRRKITINE